MNQRYFIFGTYSLQFIEVELPDDKAASAVGLNRYGDHCRVIGPGAGRKTATELRALADAIDEFAARTQPPSRA